MLPIQIINTELYRRVLRALVGKNHPNPQNPKDFNGVWDFSWLLNFFAVWTIQNFQSKIKQFEIIYVSTQSVRRKNSQNLPYFEQFYG